MRTGDLFQSELRQTVTQLRDVCTKLLELLPEETPPAPVATADPGELVPHIVAALEQAGGCLTAHGIQEVLRGVGVPVALRKVRNHPAIQQALKDGSICCQGSQSQYFLPTHYYMANQSGQLVEDVCNLLRGAGGTMDAPTLVAGLKQLRGYSITPRGLSNQSSIRALRQAGQLRCCYVAAPSGPAEKSTTITQYSLADCTGNA